MGANEGSVDEGTERSVNLAYAIDLMRAFGGAILFAFPLIMIMEMWQLGFTFDRGRFLLFFLLILLILLGLSFLAGFRSSFSLTEDALDALAAVGVGAIASTALLCLFGLLGPEMAWDEIVGKIAIQTIPASIGAMAARKQPGGGDEEGQENQGGHVGQLFLMLAGALFLGFNVAPTEEMILISFRMTAWHGLALIVLSIATLHAFVYALEFSGQEDLPGEEDDQEGGGTPALEWIAAGVGLVVTPSMVGIIGWQAIEGPDRLPPDIVVRVEWTTPMARGWVVEIVVANRSPATAAQVVVEGDLLRGDVVVATAQATFDYVAGHSEVGGGLFLAQDPLTGEVRLRALGYAKP